jgi:hypothetical protein
MEVSRTKRNINIFLFVLFALFGLVQINDPDPVIWVTLYFVVAAICLISNYRKIPRALILIVGTLLLVYAGFHFSLFIDYLQNEDKSELFGEMVYEKPYLEGTREFLGLALAAAGILYQLKK